MNQGLRVAVRGNRLVVQKHIPMFRRRRLIKNKTKTSKSSLEVAPTTLAQRTRRTTN